MNRREATLSTNHLGEKFILRPSFRSKFILRPSFRSKFILRFDFLNITVRHEIEKRYKYTVLWLRGVNGLVSGKL